MIDVYEPRFRITEIFGPTIQGEGALIGQTSHFVRFAGCDSRCTWCDTKGSVLPDAYMKPGASRKLTAYEIAKEVGDLPTASWVTLSGGNPLLFVLDELVELLKLKNQLVAVETQGTLYRPWADRVDFLTVSPKPPSACTPTASPAVLDLLLNARTYGRACLKFVIKDPTDFEFACAIRGMFPRTMAYIQPCADDKESIAQSLEKLKWLANEVLSSSMSTSFIVLPQLHKLLEVR